MNERTDEWLRVRATEGWCRLTSPNRVIESLRKMLREPRPDLREVDVEALLSTPEKIRVPTLAKLRARAATQVLRDVIEGAVTRHEFGLTCDTSFTARYSAIRNAWCFLRTMVR